MMLSYAHVFGLKSVRFGPFNIVFERLEEEIKNQGGASYGPRCRPYWRLHWLVQVPVRAPPQAMGCPFVALFQFFRTFC